SATPAAQGDRDRAAGSGPGHGLPPRYPRSIRRQYSAHAAQGARRRRHCHRWRIARQRGDRNDGFSSIRCRGQRAPQSGDSSRCRLERADRLRRRRRVSGDVIVGDGEGVVVVPKHLAEEVARDAAEQEIMEEFVTQEIAGGRALPGTYPPNAETLARYRVWREQRDKKP